MPTIWKDHTCCDVGSRIGALVPSAQGGSLSSVVILHVRRRQGCFPLVYPSVCFVFWLSWSAHSRREFVLRQVVGPPTVFVRVSLCYFTSIAFVLFDIGVFGLQGERASFLAFGTCFVCWFILYTVFYRCVTAGFLLMVSTCFVEVVAIRWPGYVSLSRGYGSNFTLLGTVSFAC